MAKVKCVLQRKLSRKPAQGQLLKSNKYETLGTGKNVYISKII